MNTAVVTDVLEGTRVLVAHPDASLRAAIRSALCSFGAVLDEAGSAREAVGSARRAAPDVMLLATRLAEALAQVRRDPDLFSVSVVMLLEHGAGLGEVLEARAAGAHDVLAEDAIEAELLARVHAAARTRELLDHLLARERALEELAYHDELTGLPNRRFVLRQLAAMLSRARRHDGTLSVLVVDADHFKALNDRHGHAAGDAVLRVLAERLGDRVRREDVVGRIGGEEFVVALPDTGPDGAAAVAEDLRSGVAAGPVRLPGVDVPVTVSVGWATWDGAEPLDGLLGRADRALYEAKAAGRDRVRPAPHGAAAR